MHHIMNNSGHLKCPFFTKHEHSTTVNIQTGTEKNKKGEEIPIIATYINDAIVNVITAPDAVVQPGDTIQLWTGVFDVVSVKERRYAVGDYDMPYRPVFNSCAVKFRQAISFKK